MSGWMDRSLRRSTRPAGPRCTASAWYRWGTPRTRRTCCGKAELWALVERLPDKLRAVIHLFYGEGYSVKETAGILGVSVPAVKMRLKRGREALRSAWEVEE